MYQCEGAVGQAITKSEIPREEIWLTSKLDNTDHAPDKVAKACRDQLKSLQTDYLDLYLIHWPLTGKAGPKLDPPIKVNPTILLPHSKSTFGYCYSLECKHDAYTHHIRMNFILNDLLLFG